MEIYDSSVLHIFAQNNANILRGTSTTSDTSHTTVPIMTGSIPLPFNITEHFLLLNILKFSQPSVITYSKQIHAFLQYIPVKVSY